MTVTPSSLGEFVRRQTRRFLEGKRIAPCRTPSLKRLPITTPYNATSPIGKPWSLGRHTGEDHAAPVGSLAIATTFGRVVCVARWLQPSRVEATGEIPHWGDSYGTHVVIRTRSGLYDYAYCHLSVASVRAGDTVQPGDVVGLTGHTGGDGNFGPHLHYETRPAGGRFGSDIHPRHTKRKAPDHD